MSSVGVEKTRERPGVRLCIDFNPIGLMPSHSHSGYAMSLWDVGASWTAYEALYVLVRVVGSCLLMTQVPTPHVL